MKFSTTTFFLLIALSQISAQLFTKVTEGLMVMTPSDSRSVNIVDLNNDGWDDVFISNGLAGGQNDFLYLNNGDGTFSTSDSDISNDGKSSVGATFADYDNDGDIDAYVTNWYGQINGLFANNGEGLLERKNDETIPQLGSYAETASWGDYDNDGWLDLCATNSGNTSTISTQKNFLFHNNGEGTFTKIDTGLITTDINRSRNADWLDIDDDADMDLLVSNESNQRNDVFLNEGGMYFSRLTEEPVVLEARSTQSFSYGDIDNDGDLDLFFANAGFYQEQNNQLFRNQNGRFVLDNNSILSSDGGCSYSSNFADYDNDGDMDLLVSNGFCNSNLRNFLYENQGDGTFEKVTDVLPDLSIVCSYGAAWGDLNNDGFLDLVIANCKNTTSGAQQANDLYLNNGNDNNWIKIDLIGTVSNKSAIGAKIQLTAEINGQTITQLRTISAQTGYSAQNSLTAHFGLGEASTIQEIKVLWPSGFMNIQQDVAVGQRIIIEEQTTSVTENNFGESRLRISPNPTRGNISVRIFSEKELPYELHLKVMDTLGRVVHQQEFHNSNGEATPIQMSVLPSGKYIVGVYHKGNLVGEEWFVKM